MPEIKTDEQALLRKCDNFFKAAISHPVWKRFETNAVIDFQYKEGDQWSEEEKAELKKRGQAPVVEDEIKPMFDRIMGQYTKQKTRIKFRGRNIGQDEVHANTASEMMLYVQQNCSYEFEEKDMVDDGLTCGFGVLEIQVEFDKDTYDPIIVMSAEDALNIHPDPQSKKYDWNKDAEFICRERGWLTLEVAQKMYPDAAMKLAGLVNSQPADSGELTVSKVFKREDYFDSTRKMVHPIEVWFKKYEQREMYYAEGQAFRLDTLPEKKKKDLMKTYPKGERFNEVDSRIKVAVFCGNVLLEYKDSPYKHGLYPFIPFFVFRKKDGEPYSIIRLLESPQSEINKRRSKALYLLQTNKAIYEAGAIADKEELAEEMARPDSQIEYKANKKFEIINNIELAASQVMLHNESKEAMHRIGGVSNEAMGYRSEIRSGVGLKRKQAMTDIIITPVFDNLRRTRLLAGKIVFALMKQFFTRESIFYITDDLKKSKQINWTQDTIDAIREAKYSVIIEEAPDTTTIQDEEFDKLVEYVRGLNLPPNYAIATIPMLIQTSQLRNKDAILEAFKQAAEPPPEHPKISLNLDWGKLANFEKAKFAALMGFNDLAQIEMQQGNPPEAQMKEEAGIKKVEIKAQADLGKEIIKGMSDNVKAIQDSTRRNRES